MIFAYFRFHYRLLLSSGFFSSSIFFADADFHISIFRFTSMMPVSPLSTFRFAAFFASFSLLLRYFDAATPLFFRCFHLPMLLHFSYFCYCFDFFASMLFMRFFFILPAFHMFHFFLPLYFTYFIFLRYFLSSLISLHAPCYLRRFLMPVVARFRLHVFRGFIIDALFKAESAA